jgi:hypothetical protein
MPRIHRLEHIQSFPTSCLANDDAIWAHAKRIDYQLSNCHLSSSLNIWRAILCPHNMILHELQFYNAIDCDHKFV